MNGCGGGGSGGVITSCLTFDGLQYCPVQSPHTAKIWLDRNLGASKVCTGDVNDTNCFGDYYQWGRLADGHEKVNSTISDMLALSIDTSDGLFITPSALPYDWVDTAVHVDDNGSARSERWRLTDGSSVCPPGYRVPSAAELKAELFSSDNNISNNADALNSFLKLPSPGYRYFKDGTLVDQGAFGALWTSDAAGDLSSDVEFNTTAASITSTVRALGQSVRCIKE